MEPRMAQHRLFDSFAKTGVQFDHAISLTPFTLPSLITMFTGLEPLEHGSISHTSMLSGNLTTLFDICKDEGIFTVLLSGNPYSTDVFGLNRNVAHYRSILVDNETSTMKLSEIREAIAAVTEQDNPSFSFIHLLPPHEPRTPTAEFADRFIASSGEHIPDDELNYLIRHGDPRGFEHSREVQFKKYLNNVAYGDFLVGEILGEIKRHGLLEKSLIIVTSDHGEAFAEHDLVGHNIDSHLNMIGIPLIIAGPSIQPGKRSDLVALIDLFPTFLEYLNLDMAFNTSSGISLKNILNGGKGGEEREFFTVNSSLSNGFSFINSELHYVHRDRDAFLYRYREDPRQQRSILAEYKLFGWLKRQQGLERIRKFRQGSIKAEEAEIDEKTLKDLQNLGYLN
jgi:arylsulfatase A-like enzyme